MSTNDYIDLTSDEGIKKKILKEGKGEVIQKDYEAIIHYFVKLNGKIIDQSEANCFLIIGDENEERGLLITIHEIRRKIRIYYKTRISV